MMTESSNAALQGEKGSPISLRAVSGFALFGLIVAWAYYARLLSFGSAGLFAPVPHGLTFNSMLTHLLHGRFDVDPDTIGDEGFLKDGLVYTYFGVLPALLRLPLLLSADFAALDLTRLSCIAAVTAMSGCKLASLLTVWRARTNHERSALLVLLAAAILFGGAEIQFLRALIYQEVILWAGALAAAFVYGVLRGCYGTRGFTPGLLAALALTTGLCLLTRVSTGLGLYAAFALLWLQVAWHSWCLAGPGWARFAALRPLLMPALTAVGFLALTGFVNYERWGDALMFADWRYYLWPVQHATDRLQGPLAQYGNFHVIRLGYGLIYYFFPIWVLRTADGSLLWSEFQRRTIGGVELPPASFLLSDPLIFGLAAFALVQLLRRRDRLDRGFVVPVLAGLFVPIVLMLTFCGMTFRYRMEFYPFFELCAFVGFGMLLDWRGKLPMLPFAVACLVGVIASHGFLMVYILTPFGDASTMMRGMDVITFYRSWFQ
jgi:hypothetical protein